MRRLWRLCKHLPCKGDSHKGRQGYNRPREVHTLLLLSGVLPQECDEGQAHLHSINIPGEKYMGSHLIQDRFAKAIEEGGEA